MKDEPFLQQFWPGYRRLCPHADQVLQLLAERGDVVEHDHIALRTYNLPPVDRHALARPFVERGWQEQDSYEFSEKCLQASYYYKPGAPKVFISELLVDELPAVQARLVRDLVGQLPGGFAEADTWVCSGRPWQLTSADYQSLAEVSEYASWVAAHGFCANHFTVAVNGLESVSDLGELVQVLESAGFLLSRSGGTIKGGACAGLAQSSTVAATAEVRFADRSLRIPGCYMEFAERFVLANGSRFEGFIARSADRIFESTDRRSLAPVGGPAAS